MPYALGVAGGESMGKRAGERKKKGPEGEEEETDSGPRVHLSARESTVLSGTTSVYLNLEDYSKFLSSVEITRFCPEP